MIGTGRIPRGLIGACCAWAMAGCPKAAPTADLQRGFEVASLRAAQAEAELETLTRRLASLEDRLQGGSGGDDDLVADLASTRGALEELTFRTDNLSGDFEQYQLNQERRLLWAEQRLGALERLLGVEPPPPPCVGPAEDCPPASSPDDPSSPTSKTSPPMADSDTGAGPSEASGSVDRVALARQRIDAGQQAAARAILEGLIEQEPDGVDLAEVRHLIWETWLNEGAYRKAARAYRDVTDRHASSRWAPWALLRSGECFEGMGHKEDARVFYQSILQSYPSSDAAPEAKRRLRRE